MRLLLSLIALAAATAPVQLSEAAPVGKMNTAAYAADGSDFPNPERGFSQQGGAPAKARAANMSLIHVYFRLDDYKSAPLPQAYLDKVQRTFDEARAGGVKVIPRLTYSFPADLSDLKAGTDAPLDRVLGHLDQLAPALRQNSDVIAFMEAGFIGAWGEWHHSSNGLETTAAKRAILLKLLRILPPSRAVALRYLRDKIAVFNRSEPIRPDEAFSGRDVSRVGHHNDCFLAAPDDWGTYRLDAPGGLAAQKGYLAGDNRFVPQGGETCNGGVEARPFIPCPNALLELKAQHWSQLNNDYNLDVLNLWRSQGCYPQIAERLGYRFRLTRARVQASANPGGALRGEIQLVNDGFAAPYNSRGLELVLRSKRTGAIYVLKLADDPRRWGSGEAHTIEIATNLPRAVLPGAYDLLLNLPDPAPRLHDRPVYSIRLANSGVWEPARGYNNLQLSLDVRSGIGHRRPAAQ
jgi:hypothetical protein